MRVAWEAAQADYVQQHDSLLAESSVKCCSKKIKHKNKKIKDLEHW
jgi:hypothetical protein